jgi:hypothetical protein
VGRRHRIEACPRHRHDLRRPAGPGRRRGRHPRPGPLQLDWRFSGTLPGTSGGDNEADFKVQYPGGNGTRETYWTVTPLAASGAPTLESIGLTPEQAAACSGYYEQKLVEYGAASSPIDWVYKRFNANNNSDWTHVPLAPGETVSSKVARNASSGLLAYGRNGIF